MVKTTVYLDDDSAVALKSLAARENTTQAQLIRRAVRKLTEEAPPPLPAGMGMFNSGRSDISTRRRELLLEAARKRRWR